jgi:beta-glucosidase
VTEHDWSSERGSGPPLVGFATSGFQVEGGYNGPGEPENNWGGWERRGRVEPSGAALELWTRYEDALDRAAAAGADSFRLSVEWTRVEPREGAVDSAALDRYGEVLDACSQRGMAPLVTLHHFAHPAWLGEDFWLQVDSPERFARHVETVAGALHDRCGRWITLNEINVLPVQSYLEANYPPGRRFDTAGATRCLDHMLAAHVLAYEAVKRRQPDSVVTTNNSSSSVYELDRLLVDLLLARSHGISRNGLRPWLVGRRRAYEQLVDPPGRPSLLERLLRRVLAGVIPLEQAFPRAVATIYASAYERCLDVVAVDFYDPVVSHHVRVPGHRSAGERNWAPSRNLWDEHPDPAGLVRYCMANQEPGIEVWVVENGLCSRVSHGRSFPRADGSSRVRYLRDNMGALRDAVGRGLRLGGYWHWTLADNYEWGSYEPRYGVHGIDRSRGVRWLESDSMGDNSASAFHEMADLLRRDGGHSHAVDRRGSGRG